MSATATMARRHYILLETLIAACFGAGMSLLFAILLFGREEMVPLLAAKSIVTDSLPQSFIVALTSLLIPNLLTRRRIRRGVLPFPTAHPAGRVANAVKSGLLVSFGIALVGTGVQALLLPRITPAAWPLMAVLIYKPFYGAGLAALMGRIGILSVLKS